MSANSLKINHLQPPSLQGAVSTRFELEHAPESHVLVLDLTLFPHVSLQADQSDHSVNTFASEVKEVKESDFKNQI